MVKVLSTTSSVYDVDCTDLFNGSVATTKVNNIIEALKNGNGYFYVVASVTMNGVTYQFKYPVTAYYGAAEIGLSYDYSPNGGVFKRKYCNIFYSGGWRVSTGEVDI